MGRCSWAREGPEIAYHDKEWGRPLHDDRALFEFVVLEGAQAGLSWATILRRREGYRRAFSGFDPRRVARYGQADVRRLMADASIIRNRAKIRSAISNAAAFLEIQKEFGSFDRYLWGFVQFRQRVNRFAGPSQVPAETDDSRRLSSDLKRRGFSFAGPVICYALMQAVGMVNDHVRGCPLHGRRLRARRAPH